MEKLRVIQVGCGGIVNSWMSTDSYQQCVELVGLVDLMPENAEKIKAKRELSADLPVYTDLSTAIKTLKPEAVFDTTVPAAHHIVTTTALKAGCHVLGEKPMAETMEQAKDMVKTAEETGLTYAVTQTRRWSPNMGRLIEFLSTDPIGQVHSVWADFIISAHFGGFREEMDHVLLLDMAIHSFDSARHLINDADPQWVQAYEWNPADSRYKHGANAIATFGFTDGTVFNYRGTWTANGMDTNWDCDWKLQGDLGAVNQSNRNGIEGQLLVDPKEPAARDGGPLIRSLNDLNIDQEPVAKFGSGHDGAIGNFVRALREGEKLTCPASDNIKSLAMVHAAIKAAESGQRENVGW